MADSPRPPKTHPIGTQLRGHSGFELPADQPHQLDVHGRKLDLGKLGRPPIPQIQIEILQVFLRDFLEAEKAAGRTPKQDEAVEKVLTWVRDKGWPIGRSSAERLIVRPVHQAFQAR